MGEGVCAAGPSNARQAGSACSIRNAISRSLESYGLGHLPRELPPNQEDPVRLYLLGSPVADVIKAVLTPSDKGDDTLRAISTSEAQEQLHQIRQIVCG